MPLLQLANRLVDVAAKEAVNMVAGLIERSGLHRRRRRETVLSQRCRDSLGKYFALHQLKR